MYQRNQFTKILVFFYVVFVFTTSLNAQVNRLSAKTYFEISGKAFNEYESEVSRGQRAFSHAITYQDEAILKQNYTDERGKIYLAGTILFKIHVEEFKTVFCGSLKFDMLDGNSTQLRCFVDLDNNGIFDQVHAGYISFIDPISVSSIRSRLEKTPTNIPYNIIDNKKRRIVGHLSFGLRNSRQRPSGLGIYVGSNEYEQFMFKSFVKARAGNFIDFNDTKVEVKETKKRSTKLSINHEIQLGTLFQIYSIHKSTIFKTITTSNIKY